MLPDYEPPRPATGRRKLIYQAGILAGLVLVFVTWALIMAGVIPPTPTDVYVTCIVLVALFTPWAAFLDNPGEQRTKVQRYAEFAFNWLLLSGIALRRIGGQTGDVLGASQQLADVACLAVLSARG